MQQNFEWNCLMWALYRRNLEIAEWILDSNLGFEMWHLSTLNESILDMIDKRVNHTYKIKDTNPKKTKKFYSKLRIKLHSMFYPVILSSDCVRNLRIPLHIVNLLLTYVY